MNSFELVIPQLGASVKEVLLTEWLYKEGDFVAAQEVVARVATDKVDSDVVAPKGGKIVERLCAEGARIPPGTVIAVMTELREVSGQVAAAESSESLMAPYLSPLVKKMLQENQISKDAIADIQGSGRGGRISKNDILQYLDNKGLCMATASVCGQVEERRTLSNDSEIIEMDRVKRLMAQHMKDSKRMAPHVTAFMEADVSALMRWHAGHRADFESAHQQKLTLTPLILAACVQALKDFPMINVSVDATETKIIKHKTINIGVATALPDGNLMVPVIKQAELLNVAGLAKAMHRLVRKAHNDALNPDDITGGTFSVSNVGIFGSLMGTPIIPQPQAAILATGVVKKRPVVIEMDGGDTIAVRPCMFLSLSFDHRVIDGALGGAFLARIAAYLEGWDKRKFD